MDTAHEVGAVKEGIRSSSEGPVEEEPHQVEEIKCMNEQRSYHFKPNPNLPTHYTPTIRNHENFSYGGEAQLLRPNDIYKSMTLLLKDYFLIPGNGAKNLFRPNYMM